LSSQDDGSESVAQQKSENRDGQRILIVDDEAAVADLIEAVLVSEGYTVAIARDGIQGILLARDWKPDLVLMDVMLPGIDGTTAIRRLKSDPATAELPIVAMSAGRTIRRQSSELSDADAALSKPFDIEALLAQIEFLLSRRRVDG
jgi:CheY-like chemotaxis protein